MDPSALFNSEPSINDEKTTPATTDDESTITTSAASDTFESWTIVTDKMRERSNNLFNNLKKPATDENRIDDLKNEMKNLRAITSTVDEQEEQEGQEDETPPNYDAATATTNATDELSDEVSIISESDSGELLAPELSSIDLKLSEHLHKLNLKFTTGVGLDLPTLLQQQQLEEQRLQQKRSVTPPRVLASLSTTNQVSRQRKRRSPSNDYQRYQKISTIPSKTAQIFDEIFFWLHIVVLLIGIYAIINFIVTKAGFYGEPPRETTSTVDTDYLLTKIQEIDDHIDLLWTELSITGQQIINSNAVNTGKSLEECHRNYEKPYWMPKEEPSPDFKIEPEPAIIEATEDTTKNSQNSLTKTPYKAVPDSVTESESKGNGNGNSDHDGLWNQQPTNKHDFKQRHSSKEFKEHSGGRAFKQQPQKQQQRNKESDNSKERLDKHDKHFDNSKERIHKTDNSKERFDKHNNNNIKNSKERFNHKTERDNPKEHHNKFDSSKEHQSKNYKKFNERDSNNNRNDNSKERNDKSRERKQSKQQRKPLNSDEHQSGEWMEKLMQQREEARRQQEQILEAEKNWYLNRQDSREQWRNVESRR